VRDTSARRWGHASAIVGGMAIMVGGFGGPAHQRLGDLWQMALSTAAPPGMVPVQEWRWAPLAAAGPAPCARIHHSAITLAGSVWVFGGRSSPTLAFNDLHALDVAAAEWRRVVPTDGGLRASNGTGEGDGDVKGESGDDGVPSPRWRHAACALDAQLGASSAMAVFGGRDAVGLVDVGMHIFEPASGSWSRLNVRGDCLTPRHSHTMTNWGNQLLVVSNSSALLIQLQPGVPPEFVCHAGIHCPIALPPTLHASLLL